MDSARTLITQLGVAVIAHSQAVALRFDIERVVRGNRVCQQSDHGEQLIVDEICGDTVNDKKKRF